MFRRSSASRAGHRQPGPQGRYSSSTDATNAGELTAAGWPRQVTIHRIGPKSFAVKKFQGQGGREKFREGGTLAALAALAIWHAQNAIGNKKKCPENDGRSSSVPSLRAGQKER
jgi:hypothetical protein